MTRWIVLALLSVGFAGPLKAEEELTGNVLYKWCTGETRTDQALCLDYITGFFGGLASAQTLARAKHLAPVTCFPDEFTTGQHVSS